MFNTQTASVQELKKYASDNNIAVTGDKRRKQSYIDAIESHMSLIENTCDEVLDEVQPQSTTSQEKCVVSSSAINENIVKKEVLEVRVDALETASQVNVDDTNGLLLVIVVYIILILDIYKVVARFLKPRLIKLSKKMTPIINNWFYDHVDPNLSTFNRSVYTFIDNATKALKPFITRLATCQ